MSVFGKLWRSSPEHSPRHTKEIPISNPVESLDTDQPCNPYTELQVFTHHTDIVRHLVAIDESRFASAGDDGSIVIWDLECNKKQCVLTGHSRPLTCLCLLQPASGMSQAPTLVSAASDKLICMWDAEAGTLLQSLSGHGGTARAIVAVADHSMFCCGGDRICLWNRAGRLLHALAQHGKEDVSQLLETNDGKIVAVVDKLLVVYAVQASTTAEQDSASDCKLRPVKTLPPHREAVRSLINVSDESFASGSLDGTIIVWSAQSLTPLRCFNSIQAYEGDDKHYPYSVQCLHCIQERYLVSAVGAGFCICDIVTGQMLAEKAHAHFSKVLHLAVVYDGYLLATCSEDGSIRLWGCLKSFNAEQQEIDESQDQNGSAKGALDRLLGVSKADLGMLKEKDEKISPQLLGECLGHSGAVQMCLDCGAEGLVTCGVDGLVLRWKDGVHHSNRRNSLLRDVLIHGDSLPV